MLITDKLYVRIAINNNFNVREKNTFLIESEVFILEIKTKIENIVVETKQNLKNLISTKKENINSKILNIKEKNEIRKKQNALIKKLKLIVAIIIFLIVLLFAGIFVYERYFVRHEQETITETSSVLIETKDIAKLQVANIIYNSVATIDKDGNVTQKVFGEKEFKKNVSYYISYKGEIIVDYDLSKVVINTDDTTQEIIVSIPSPTLTPNVVDAQFNHIFIDKKAEKEYSPSKAREACKKDLEIKFEDEKDKLYKIAENNCKDLISSYISIFNDKNYEIKYIYLEDNIKW